MQSDYNNYIIIVHKSPTQLKRLIDKLDAPNQFFYIHVDLKADLDSFKNVISKNNVFFIQDRVNCIWGDYSLTQAALKLIKKVLNSETKGRIISLSGQDYPIKPTGYITDFLQQYADYDFISYTLDPVDEQSELYLSRVKKYKFNLSERKKDYLLLPPLFDLTKRDIKKVIGNTFNGRLNPLHLKEIFTRNRKSPFANHYKGSNWWSFQLSTAQKIFDYYTKHQSILDTYYRRTLISDEQFFHTLLRQIEKESGSPFNTLPYLHFVDWSRKNVPCRSRFERKI